MKVFVATDPGDDWPGISGQLSEAFQFTQQALTLGEPVVYVVHNDDLLGRRGIGASMVACGLLSAARSAALEGVRSGWTINVIAVEDSTNAELVDQWVEGLERTPGPSGELIHLGPGHLGRALP